MSSGADVTVHAVGPDGVVRDWLVAGPWSLPVPPVQRWLDPEGDPFGPRGRWVLSKNPEADDVKFAMSTAQPPFEPPAGVPTEDRPLRWGDLAGTWSRRHVPEDGFVDWSGFSFNPQARVALAGVVLRVPASGYYPLTLTATGGVAAFVDGATLHRDVVTRTQDPVARTVSAFLHEGDHALVVATSTVAMREYRHVLSVALLADDIAVVLPSPGADVEASLHAERRLDAVGVQGCTSTDARWQLTGPDGVDLVVDEGGRRHHVRLAGGAAELDLGTDEIRADSMSSVRRGERLLRVSVDDGAARGSRDLSVVRIPADYRGSPIGTPDRWRREVLDHAAGTGAGVTAALADIVRGATTVRTDCLDHALTMLADRADCADFEALALLNLWHRAGPAVLPADYAERIATAVQGFKYWIEEPGLDCMCYFTENHQIVYHAAQLIAGETFPGQPFPNSGVTGREHAAAGERRCRTWITERLRHGFIEFDSNTYLAIDVFALVSIIDLCADDDLRAMAVALLDKLLFNLASNSWRGIHGSSHGRSYAQALLTGRVEETSPLQRLAWGMGSLNEGLLPAVALAGSARYRVPEVIRRAGAHLPDEWWGRQRAQGTFDFRRDLRRGTWSSASVIWKTPDGMLASVQDHRPGQPGYQEHIWQATLSPEAIVFANHPANSSTSSSARPNYWAGNRVLPRVRQNRDALLCLFRLPRGDRMGCTHAWFPTPVMDEWRWHGRWAVGRVGDGYVALTGDGTLRLQERGATAGQELRVDGGGRAWICQLGRAHTHGSFASFCDQLSTPTFGDVVVYRTPDGRTLELGWDSPWRVNGAVADPVEAFPHFDNPLTDTPMGAERMTIRLGDDVHELDLFAGRRC